ncbi:alkaline phosphatase family protein [Microvirga sp. VF16]|uniref:alkaline phosphatase family protein n=1 Tax=Microvirga sp. VF16 TaxID=2807101 RepID=UPI00193E5BFA|nr:nucleotide pyrophosphatase/phosphodiesterase family protein [Microvirga sp. VF16]QRM32395.1 alkaline phosphatase family protein [Microvirga sp. VF16]
MPRFLLVSFDGLRPDLIDRKLTPNICRLQNAGVTLAQHRTIYPSETRSAFPSLVTGTTASRHGMVGNKYVDRATTPPRYIDTSNAVLLDELNRESGGRLMSAPTLGEILAANGRSLAVLATNTPGTTRLFHHKAEQFGHVRLSGHFREACTPNDMLAEVEARFGVLPPVPPKGEPDIEAQALITSTFLDLLWPRLKPDVTILSYGEPDTCSHLNGTGASKTREVIAFCDRQLGRLIDWWEAEGKDAGVQIIIASDHGHITAHTRVSVADSLCRAGFSPGTAPDVGIDVVVVPGQVGALYLSERSPVRLAQLVEVVTAQPWCGPVFTAPRNEVEGIAPGSLGTHLVFADHARTPDVYFAFRADDSVDPFGLVGGTFYDNDRRPGLGVHGGLHPKELAAVGIVAGPAFRGSGFVSLTPTNICDFAPTILHLLGIIPPATMSGRVLFEAMDGEWPIVTEIKTEIFEATIGGYSQALRRVQVGSTSYLDGGWAGSQAAVAARQMQA